MRRTVCFIWSGSFDQASITSCRSSGNLLKLISFTSNFVIAVSVYCDLGLCFSVRVPYRPILPKSETGCQALTGKLPKPLVAEGGDSYAEIFFYDRKSWLQ